MNRKLIILLLSVPALLAKDGLIRLPRVDSNGSIIKHGRIIGGDVAAPGEYPYQVAIYTTTPDGRFFCAGTLITDQWILTAAQCVHEATQFSIQMGSNQLSGTDANRVTVTASQYVIHEKFDPTISLDNDIGLIKLDEPITVTEFIEPIRIYGQMGYLSPGRVLTAIGWGQASDANTSLVNELQSVQVSIYQMPLCKNFYGDQLVDGMLCTMGLTNNEGICYGDIGGPLLSPTTNGSDYKVVMAISSWISQNGCESPEPSGYTRVDWYRHWIAQAMEDN